VLIFVENLPVPFGRRVWQESLALQQARYEHSQGDNRSSSGR